MRPSSQVGSIRSRSQFKSSIHGSRPGTGKYNLKLWPIVASIISGSKAPTSVYSEINENDEWAAIQKFNTMLHFEEQKQAVMRDIERKKLIREQLAKQVAEKHEKKEREFKEELDYNELAEHH